VLVVGGLKMVKEVTRMEYLVVGLGLLLLLVAFLRPADQAGNQPF
jgi:hypothetical protein